jgi:nucleoid-associated protein YgaU
MRKLLAGLVSLVTLVVLLVGIPAVLIVVAGNPIPSWDVLQAVATGPDYGGRFLLGNLLPMVAWVAWASFAVSVISVIPSTLRGLEPPRFRGLGLQQSTAAALLGSVIIMFTGFGGVASASAVTAPTTPSSMSQGQQTAVASTEAPAADSAAPQLPLYEVKAGDTLWTIAESQLGDGKRYTEIAKLNYGVTQEDGGKLTPENRWVAAGWILEMPADAGTHAAAPSTAAAAAAAAAPIPAASASAEAAVSAPVGEALAAVPVVTVAAVQDEQRTIQPGDTLWGIAAEEYGAGERYPEIVAASQGAVQPDGRQLTDADVILPGWQVTVPGVVVDVAAVPVAPAPAPEEPVAPTSPSDSGTGVGAASIDETGGAGAGAGAGANAAAEAGAGAAGGAGSGWAGGAADDATGSSSSREGLPSDVGSVDGETPDVEEDEYEEVPASTMTVGGIGALLASGILTLLGIRRFQQRRRRQPGQRIAMPEATIAMTELELRAIEDPQGVEDIDHALRYLAWWARDTKVHLPKLFALRLSEETVELYLEEAAELPLPFVSTSDDQMAWSVKAQEIPAFSPEPTAPYPGLVTLGQDEKHGHILIDLEQIGSLNIVGPDEKTTEGALVALAVELACSTWADDLQITLVGFAPELAAAFDTGRVQHIDDVRSLMSSLRGRARAYTHAFGELQVDSPRQARTIADTDTWTPEIVLLRELPDEKTQAELVDLIERTPRVGIAAITSGHLTGPWSLNIAADHSAVLHPAGISIHAQVLAGEEYQHILTSLAVTGEDATTPTPEPSTELSGDLTDPEKTASEESGDATDAETPVRSGRATLSARWNASTAEADTTEADAPERTEADAASDLDAEQSPSAAAVAIGSVDDESTGSSPTATPPVAAAAVSLVENSPAEEPALTAPIIRVFGRIRVEGAKGPEPRTAKTNYVASATELLAYLAFFPNSPGDQVSKALWKNTPETSDRFFKNRNELASRARRWLGGTDGEESEAYVLNAHDSVYGLHPDVTSDWDLWKGLVGQDPARASTENLIAAMKLIEGPPFDGRPPRRYVWADQLEKNMTVSIIQNMTASIVDAAHELATRALATGDAATARFAATVGEMVDPASEIPIRDRLRAEDLADNPAGIDQVTTRLHLRNTVDLETSEPDEETQEILDEIHERRKAS